MATTPKNEPTEAEQYAAEEQARVDAIAAKKEQDDAAAAEAATAPDPKAGAKPAAAKAKPATKPAPARARAAKDTARTEVYEQRGPKGLFKVTRNIDTGESTAELIGE